MMPGIDIMSIQLFGRWDSDTIRQYVKEAPLAVSTRLAPLMAAAQEEREKAERAPAWAASSSSMVGLLQAPVGSVEVERSPQVEDATLPDEAPEFVMNLKSGMSKVRAHIPRDALYAFCGWPWAEAIQAGTAAPLSARAAEGVPRCGPCTFKAAGTSA